MTMEWRIEIRHGETEHHLWLLGIHLAAVYHVSKRRPDPWRSVVFSPVDGLSLRGAPHATLKQAREWCELEVGK